MYNVSVGPSKIVAKTRRGISQNLESFQNFSRKPLDLDNGEVMNGPKPVFHTNSKKFNNSKQQEIISPQHEELIRFVSESWSKIFKEYESDGLEQSETFSTSNSSSSIMYYEDPEPNAFLQKKPKMISHIRPCLVISINQKTLRRTFSRVLFLEKNIPTPKTQ